MNSPLDGYAMLLYVDDALSVLLRCSLREKCPNTEFFLVRIFLHSDRIRSDKTPYLNTFHAVNIVLRKRSWLLYLYFPLKKFKVTSDYSTKANS